MLHRIYCAGLLITVLTLTACSATVTQTPAIPLLPTGTATSPPTNTAPPPSATPSPTIEPTAVSYPVLALVPADPVVRVYPGSEHYEGDQLIVEISTGGRVEASESTAMLSVDGADPIEVTGEWEGNRLLVPVDTSGLEGEHNLHIQADPEGVLVDEDISLRVLPASQRPAQEDNPEWLTRDLPCCTLHYISNTAADRDIEQISEVVQDAADDLNTRLDVDVNEKIDIYLIDRMWGNGGFGGGGELLASYTDRYYGPTRGREGLRVLVQHELAHAVELGAPYFRYSEGLGVFLAGGHYKPEPIPERAAAMLDLGYYNESTGPSSQHEIFYLHQAARVAYIVDVYGWDALWAYMRADSGQPVSTQPQQEQALQQTLGIGTDEFNNGFNDWLHSHEAGAQLDDLRLTVALQNLRRSYQERYAPEPHFLLGTSSSYTRPEFLQANIREANAPANVATELMIANAQQAIIDAQYEQAADLIAALEDVIDTGRLADPLAAEYGAIAYTMDRQGYEAVSLALNGDEAVAEATQSPPQLETFTLHKSSGLWQVEGLPDISIEAPTATPTGAPVFTATPAAAPTSLPTDALYFDDFSDPNSGWEQHTDDRSMIGYEDGAYRISLGMANALYWFDAGQSFTDAAVETSVVLHDGPDVNPYGLFCRYDSDSGSMYMFLLDGQGRYGIVRQEQGQQTFLGAEGMQPASAILPPGEANVVWAVCSGSTLSLSVNGERLAEVQDTALTGGDVGFVTGTSGGAGLDVTFDYILVTAP